ncbi:transcription antitermination factor NusB [Floricoccus penangensis]|uniref:Transcription antitermination protein NusB n=1 Tax=Floricoccus penangensis TaxID=1859475 RepID=A0A9Q5NZ60_9LACT|nr:transcription antitermination factor NusB [Floricoccus penangensis]OFI46231.1 transcription antitermination factor NusB [Floricoccus penangensis]URZ86948.1 transcription antitermination factor NusB [Floricoccus penangensis]
MPSKKMSQHEIRMSAVQALYSLELQDEATVTDAMDFVLSYDEFPEESPAYLETLIRGVQINKEKLDENLAKYIKNPWSLDRLTNIDRVILRLGAYEILETETPNVVAVNEAIELAKNFNDEKSAKFINGVLTNLV